MVSGLQAAFALASERASGEFPHGTNDADALADILRHALADLEGAPPTVESLLRKFIDWRDRAQDGDAGCDYLNGDYGSGTDGWKDLDEIAEQSRAVLARGEHNG